MVPTMPNSSPGPVVGVDLGGTSVKAGLVSADLELLAQDAAPTDISDEEVLLTEIEQLVRRIAGVSGAAAVGFGLPSQIDQRSGRVADSINVPITDVPFVAEMTARLDLPVKVDNDANVACLAEARIGAARGRDNVIMLDARDRCRRRDRARRAALPRFDRLRRRARAHGDRRERSAVPGPLPQPRLPREPGVGRRRSRGGRPDRGGAAGRDARNRRRRAEIDRDPLRDRRGARRRSGLHRRARNRGPPPRASGSRTT